MNPETVFREYLENHSNLKKQEIELISNYFSPQNLYKEEPLVRAGDRFDKIVFVTKGILRVFIINSEGEEVTKNFLEKNSFFSDIDSFDRGIPAHLNVSSITESSVLVLSKTNTAELISLFPAWEGMMKAGIVNSMNEMIQKQEFLRIGDSSSQYRYFVENFPNLAQHVPLKYVASYLRITQSSLSRIRKQGW